jgi:insulysin
MDTRSLDITFPYLDEEKLFRTQPSRYAAHLIGHEGPGSILAYLKKKGWANGLSAGPTSVCNDAAFFYISIRLTEEGLGKNGSPTICLERKLLTIPSSSI